MSGPWEKFQSTAAAPQEGPWTKFKSTPRPAPANGDGDVSANNVIRSIGTGVPVIGGALNEMNAATNAALAPLLNPLLSEENQLKGDTWRDRYERSLAMQEGMDQAYEQAHPYLAGAGHVTGAVAGTLPMLMAAPEAMGAGGGSLLTRTAASTASGAVIGGADSAVRSDGDFGEVKKGLEYGALGGFIAPAAGQIIGSGINAARNAISDAATRAGAGLSRYSANYLSKSLAADGLTAADAAARLDSLGPEALLSDLGPTLQGDTAALANIPGRAKQIVREALGARAAGADARLAEGINGTLGPARIPSQVTEGIEQAQKALGPFYDDVLEGAKAVDMTDVANALESQIVNLRGPAQRAAQQVRGMLDIPGAPGNLDPSPQAALQVRHAIDGLMKTEADPNTIRALTIARQAVDEKLAQSVPGIKAVDAQYEELARQDKAFTAGRSALDTGKTTPHPVDVQRAFQEGALPEGVLVGPSASPTRYAQGMRAEIDRILGGNANDVATLNRILKSEGDWNPQKLATAFGPEKADQLVSLLEREKLFAETRNAAVGNSVTAGRAEAMRRLGAGSSDFGVRQAYEAGGMLGLARSAALKTADKMSGAVLGPVREAGRTSIANALTGDQQRLVNALMEIEARNAVPATPSKLAQALMLA